MYKPSKLKQLRNLISAGFDIKTLGWVCFTSLYYVRQRFVQDGDLDSCIPRLRKLSLNHTAYRAYVNSHRQNNHSTLD